MEDLGVDLDLLPAPVAFDFSVVLTVALLPVPVAFDFSIVMIFFRSTSISLFVCQRLK